MKFFTRQGLAFDRPHPGGNPWALWIQEIPGTPRPALFIYDHTETPPEAEKFDRVIFWLQKVKVGQRVDLAYVEDGCPNVVVVEQLLRERLGQLVHGRIGARLKGAVARHEDVRDIAEDELAKVMDLIGDPVPPPTVQAELVGTSAFVELIPAPWPENRDRLAWLERAVEALENAP